MSLHSTITAALLRAATMPTAPVPADLAQCTGSEKGAASPRTVIVVATWEMAVRVHADAVRFFDLTGRGRGARAMEAPEGTEVAAEETEAAGERGEAEGGRASAIRCCVLHARGSLHRQLHSIGLGCDLLVATPALLEEITRHRIVSLSCAMLLVVLDTDWMIKNGHREKLDAIILARTRAAHDASRNARDDDTMLPYQEIGRQTLIVSTAFNEAGGGGGGGKRGNNFAAAAMDWANTYALCEPVLVRADLLVPAQHSGAPTVAGEIGGPSSTTPSVAGHYVSTFVKLESDEEKPAALLRIVSERSAKGRILVFFNSKVGVQLALPQLTENGIQNVFAIHGRMTPNQRADAISKFVGSPSSTLLATEVVSRWVDTLPQVRACACRVVSRLFYSLSFLRDMIYPHSSCILLAYLTNHCSMLQVFDF